MTTRKPTHPGAILREDVFPALGLTIKDAAQALHVSRQALHNILREENPAQLSPSMALRLAKLLGNSPEMWLNMQRQYDLWCLLEDPETKAELEEITPIESHAA